MSDAQATIIAAALAVVGTLITATVAAVGYWFQRILSERNERLQIEQEERLRLDTAIQAISMMSTSTGHEVSETQRAGALFVLAQLGQLDSVLTLLEPLWARGKVDSDTAIWLLDEALSSEDRGIADWAASVLASNADRLLGPKGDFFWPQSLQWSWNCKLSVEGRELLLIALMTIISSRPKIEWNPDSLASAFISFHAILVDEPDPSTRVGAAIASLILLEALG